MVKSGLGLFAGRRKSQGNVIEDIEPKPVADASPAAETGSGGFRLMTTTEAEARKRDEKRRTQEKAASRFRPFSSLGGAHNKSRNHSYEDDSPPSSKRYVDAYTIMHPRLISALATASLAAAPSHRALTMDRHRRSLHQPTQTQTTTSSLRPDLTHHTTAAHPLLPL
jgi:hypothetical protein